MINGIPQVNIMGNQMYPGSSFFMNAYNDATKKPYVYLLVDVYPNSPYELMLRADVFSKTPTIYLP